MNKLSILQWESEFFGLPMGRMNLDRATQDMVAAMLDQARRRNLSLVEAFCSLADDEAIWSLEQNGFRQAGVKAYLTRPTSLRPSPTLAAGLSFEPAGEEDLSALLYHFGGIYADSRYYNYRCLDPGLVRKLYEVWLTKAVFGQFDDLCLLLRVGGEPAALCTLKLSDGSSRIGLFGVSQAHRRKGLGLLLLGQVEGWLRQRNVGVLTTATQGRNFAALRFYERAGFLLDYMETCHYRRLD